MKIKVTIRKQWPKSNSVITDHKPFGGEYDFDLWPHHTLKDVLSYYEVAHPAVNEARYYFRGKELDRSAPLGKLMQLEDELLIIV